LTQFGQPLGTPAYMSPEQVAGAVAAMGPGCDIYALGVILYQLLTGRLPFEGPVAEVLAQIVTQAPEPPSKHRPSLDRRVAPIGVTGWGKPAPAAYPPRAARGAGLGASWGGGPLPVPLPLGLPVAIPAAGDGVHPRLGWPARLALWLLLGGGLAATGVA